MIDDKTSLQEAVRKYMKCVKDDGKTEVWKCHIGLCSAKLKRMKGNGWRNPWSHLDNCHSSIIEGLEEATMNDELNDEITDDDVIVVKSKKQKTLELCALPSKERSYYEWIKFIIECKLPLTIVGNSSMKTFLNGSKPTMCYNTLKKYMAIVHQNMVEDMKKVLPPKFGIIFDGWSKGSEYYVAIFAWWISPDSRPKQVLISFKSLHNYQTDDELEAGQSALHYNNHISSLLKEFNRCTSDILFVSCDNCKANVKLCRDFLRKPMIGCFSHLLNLMVDEIFGIYYGEIIRPIKILMQHLNTYNGSFKNMSGLKPVLLNETRWVSCFNMLKRYEDFVKPNMNLDMNDSVICSYVNDIEKHRQQLDILLNVCSILLDSTLGLQEEKSNIHIARSLFDRLLDDLPKLCEKILVNQPGHVNKKGTRQICPNKNLPIIDFGRYLARDSKILLSADFLNAVYSLNSGSQLSNSEKNLLKDFKIGRDVENVQASISKNYFAALKQSVTDKLSSNGEYLDLRNLVCGSVVVERAFSKSDLFLPDIRLSTEEETLEILMFLSINTDFWSPKSVLIQKFKNEKNSCECSNCK